MTCPREKVFLYINDTPGTLCYELEADTHFVSPADMAGWCGASRACSSTQPWGTRHPGHSIGGDTGLGDTGLVDTAVGATGAVPAMDAVR